jgi:hypothetical protein
VKANRKKNSRVPFHLLSLSHSTRTLKHCHNTASLLIPTATLLNFYQTIYSSISVYLYTSFRNLFLIITSSHNCIMATSTRVIRLPRDDDESAHVLIQVAQKGSKPLDVKLVGTEGEAPYVAICIASSCLKFSHDTY